MSRMQGASVRSTVLAGLLALLALCCVCPLWATPATAVAAPHRDKPISAFYREIWTTRQGLPHNQVNAIDQTPDGYLWLGTWEGLVRYNGLEFQIFDRKNTPALKDNGIRSVRASADGAVVIGTSRGGVTIKRGDDWQTLREEDGLAQDEIMDAVLDRQGRLWVATESRGITRIDGTRRTQFNISNGRLKNNVVFALQEDPDGSMWAATANGLVRITGDATVYFGQAAGLPNAPIFSLLVQRDGTLLVGSERGLYRKEKGAGRFTLLSSHLPNDGVPSLDEDAEGRLWIGTVNNGLYRLSGEKVEHFTSSHELPNNRIPSLLVDVEGSIWAGTNAGLMRLSDAPFTTWNSDQGLSDDYVRALYEAPDGGIWIGTGRGLNLWRDNRVVQQYTKQDGFPGDSILSLLESKDGTLLVGSYTDGVLRLRDGKVVARYHNAVGMPGSNQVRALVEDRAGNLWIGTSRGLVRLRDGHYQMFGQAQGLPRDFVISLHLAKDDSLWVGTSDGVARIQGDKVTTIDLHPVNGAQDVFGFLEDADGTMWMTTDRGLVRYRNGELRGLGLEDGLPVDTVFAVLDDGLGNLWLTSNRGVMRVVRKDVEALLDGRLHQVTVDHFGEADGLVSAQCNGGSGPVALRDRLGNLWVATARGAAVVSPASLHDYHRNLPAVVLEQILADDQPIPMADALQLPPGTRKLEFRYAAPSFLMSRFLRYRHRLQGMDANWASQGGRRIAQYTNLGPGHFRFEVNASAPGLGQPWSKDVTSIDVTIAPQLWQRTSIRVAAVLAVLLMVLGLYRWRMGNLRRRAQHLEKIVESRTQDLREHAERLRVSDIEKTALLGKLSAQSEAFERMALEDALTGIFNRRGLDKQLAKAFDHAVSHGEALSFALFDVDHFKQINDRYSHDAGDRALIAVAHALRDGVGSHGMVARWGGEEFAVLLPAMPLAAARDLCETLRLAVAAIDCDGYAPGWSMSVSAGVAERSGALNHEKLVNRADALMYEAKRAGRNQVCG